MGDDASSNACLALCTCQAHILGQCLGLGKAKALVEAPHLFLQLLASALQGVIICLCCRGLCFGVVVAAALAKRSYASIACMAVLLQDCNALSQEGTLCLRRACAAGAATAAGIQRSCLWVGGWVGGCR